MSFASVASILGWALAVLAAAMLLPMAVGVGYGELEAVTAFGIAAVLTAFAAGLLVIVARGSAAAGTKRESIAAVVAVWLVVPVFAALPFLTTTAVEGPVNAYFESVSGLTTTGATAIPSLDAAEHAILIWRALLQWLGGVATVVLVVVHFAHLGFGGMQLYPGVMLHGEQDPLLDRLRQTGLAVSMVFGILATMCFGALLAAGFPIFDAVAHALSAVSTGGFSTRDGSVGAFANPAAEVVLMGFMLFGATNASLFWTIVRHNSTAAFFRDPEFPWFVGIALLGGCAIAAALLFLTGTAVAPAMRHGLFAAVSAITTTGFASGEGIDWPLFAPLLLLVLMMAGGCTGSTAGGLKTMRVLLLRRFARRGIARLSHPHGVEGIRYGRMTVDAEAILAVWAFFVVLAFGFGLLTVGLALAGFEFREAVFAAGGVLSNSVPATAHLAGGTVTYDQASAGARLLMCLGMILGRLEFFTALILVIPFFWRR